MADKRVYELAKADQEKVLGALNAIESVYAAHNRPWIDRALFHANVAAITILDNKPKDFSLDYDQIRKYFGSHIEGEIRRIESERRLAAEVQKEIQRITQPPHANNL